MIFAEEINGVGGAVLKSEMPLQTLPLDINTDLKLAWKSGYLRSKIKHLQRYKAEIY